MIRTNSIVSQREPIEVQFKIDDDATVQQLWSAQGAVVSENNPTKLIKRLAEAKMFVAEFTNARKQKQTVRFDTSNLKNTLEFVSDVCEVK